MAKIPEEQRTVSLMGPLDPRRTAMVVVDLQYGTASRAMGLGKLLEEQGRESARKYRYDRVEQVVIPNVQRLLSFFRKHGLRIIYLKVGSEMPDYSDIVPHRRAFRKAIRGRVGEREHEILDEVKPQPGELVINKTTTGAFNSSSIDSVLRAMGIECCIFAGVATEMCVEGTVRDASDRGYQCIVIEDGCATTEEAFHHHSLMIIERAYGKVCMTDQMIRELNDLL